MFGDYAKFRGMRFSALGVGFGIWRLELQFGDVRSYGEHARESLRIRDPPVSPRILGFLHRDAIMLRQCT